MRNKIEFLIGPVEDSQKKRTFRLFSDKPEWPILSEDMSLLFLKLSC